MQSWTDASDWLDLLDHGLIGLVLICVAVIPALINARSVRRNHATIAAVDAKADAIVGQVVNGHAGKPALRVDIDVIRDEIVGIRDEMRGAYAALRADLAEERVARRAGDEVIRDEISRQLPPDDAAPV